MLTKYLKTTTLPQVLHNALNILGDRPKDALFYHLDCDYGIHVFGAGPTFIDELEWAFSDMFGESGCELLIPHLHSEAERFRTRDRISFDTGLQSFFALAFFM
jgi:hypothetical protein